MAAINDLISQIQDETLRNRIQEEVSKMAKQKKFGLVFEEHMPESTPLYDMPIKRGCNVMRRDSKDDKSIYVVLRVEGDTAVCVKPEQKDEAVTFDLKDIVRVAEFGESIYPYLKPLDSVCNAPDSDLWHTLIEADNYHALQLLEYLYAGKVDCIYIDPPYNTGAKDWKYNNDYVDGNDAYRHSKWLSFMQRRLQLAKKLLNPEDSVLIVTIDEKEYLHLGCLLEEMFPEARMQMVSSMINPANVARVGEFGRSGEYLFFVMLGKSSPQRVRLSREWVSSKGRTHTGQVRWDLLKRSGTNSERKHSPGGFYPIYINDETGKIEEIGDPLAPGVSVAPIREGCTALLPIRQNGSEGNWQWATDTFRSRMAQGRVRIGGNKSNGLHDAGKYDELTKQVMEMKLSVQIFDVFGEKIQSDNQIDMFTASESDLDRQLRVADAKMGGCGFHLAYGRKYIDFDNPNAFKVDCILFAFDSECIAELNKYAEKKFHELNDQYRKYIVAKPEKCQKQYSDIVANGDEISKHNFTLPETISAKVEADGIKYTDHLFANADGIAKIKLNGWEQAVLAEEQKREDYVCWLRNPSRQSWSLRMPYEMDGKCKELYPDFIIVRQDPILKYIVDILEPHNPDFKDNLGKAKGLANYAANEPRIGRVQLIRIGKDAAGENRFKRLDLAKGSIRNKVLAAISTDELDHIFDTDGVFED